MGSITISGLATGMDTDSIVSQLMAVERLPETIMNRNKAKLQNKLSEYNRLVTLLNNFKSLMAGMNSSATFKSRTSSVADSSVASVVASSTAQTGSHTLKVTSLARSQTMVSDSSTLSGYASSTDKNFGTGTITISDLTGGGSDVTVNIDATNNSLEGIANAINDSGANVTASIINDGSGTPYRLTISGKDTNTYSLTSALSGGTYDNPTFTEKLAASKAVFQLDGIDMQKTSNTVSDAISGVTLTLLKANDPDETTIAVNDDPAGITEKINSFIKSYNETMALINEDTKYDTKTKSAGVLFGDSTINTVKSMLQSVLTSQVSDLTGDYTSLSQIGIKSDKTDGTLSLDAAALSEALNKDYDGVVALFTKNSGTEGLNLDQYGIAEQFNRQIDTLTHFYSGASNSGLVSTRINGLNESIENINDQVERFEQRMVMMEARLKAQFTAMEQVVSNLTSWGNQMIAALNSLSNITVKTK